MQTLYPFFAAGSPTITVLLGILLSQFSVEKLGKRTDGVEKRIDSLEQRLDTRFNRVESRLDRIEAGLREFYRTLGQHEVCMDALDKRGA